MLVRISHWLSGGVPHLDIAIDNLLHKSVIKHCLVTIESESFESRIAQGLFHLLVEFTLE